MSRLLFVANSPLNAVFTFILLSFCSVSHTLEHYFSRVLQKLSQLNVIRVYHTRQYTVSNIASRQMRDHSLSLVYSPTMCTKRRSNYNFAPASRAILAMDCLCPTARRSRLAWQSSSIRSMHSSYRGSHAKHSTRVATWPHCFSNSHFTRLWFFMSFSLQSLDHVTLFHGALACDSFIHVVASWYIQNIITF